MGPAYDIPGVYRLQRQKTYDTPLPTAEELRRRLLGGPGPKQDKRQQLRKKRRK